MLVSPYRAMLAAAPEVHFEPVDDLVERLRAQKSTAEVELLRDAAAVGSAVARAIIEAALEPGVTEAEAVAAGYALAVAAGAATYDAAVASGPNSDFYAFGRLPSWTTRKLETGDLFHVDTYGAVNGYFYDLARSCVVGGAATADQADVLESVVDAVEAGVDALRPGVPAHSIYGAVQAVPEQRGMTGDGEATAAALVTSFPSHGHSLGLGWERPWIMREEEATIRAGMCICIEAMGGHPGVGSACFEQAVVVTNDGTEVLTTAPTRVW
jgi:Xaa-Pro aminopeptidase